jgi:hypothetical protein
MSTNTQQILDELYALDPALRSEEARLIQIIDLMQKTKPNIEINEQFRARLRSELLKNTSSSVSGFAKYRFTIVSSVLSSVFASLVVGVGVWWLLGSTSLPSISSSGVVSSASSLWVSFAPVITDLGPWAFGQALTTVSSPVSSARPTPERQALVSSVSPLGTQDAISVDPQISSKMMVIDPSYQPTIYEYTYTGTLQIATGSQAVYRRKNMPIDTGDISHMLGSMHIDGFDIGSLKNTKITNLTLVEDRAYGYSVSLDFLGGTVGIYQNTQWPQPKCDQNGCETLPEISRESLENTWALIQIADRWIQDYQINRSLYGSPRVEVFAYPIGVMADGVTPEPYRVPDLVTVVYPLLLDGKNIYEEYGTSRGLSLSIDLRSQKISSVYGIEKVSLERSQYESETDTGVIMQMIRQGGRYEGWNPENAKKVTLSLGEPVLTYVVLSGEYRDGESPTYYVPAYRFPVLGRTADMWAPESIMIPLVRGFAVKNNWVIASPELMVR